jgi:hypothetical protein
VQHRARMSAHSGPAVSSAASAAKVAAQRVRQCNSAAFAVVQCIEVFRGFWTVHILLQHLFPDHDVEACGCACSFHICTGWRAAD